MKRMPILILLTLIVACGGNDDLENRVDVLETTFNAHRHHVVGDKTSEPIERINTNKTKKQSGQANDAPSLQPQSPIGRIAFESDGEIYAINSDGTHPKNLTNHLAHDAHPAWAPDRQIAFASERGGSVSIFVMDEDGTNQRLLVKMDRRPLDSPCYSPHGGAIVFTERGDHIQIGGNIKPVFVVEGKDPAWSSLGQIAYVSKPPVERNGPPRVDGIYVMSPHGGGAERLMLTDEYGEYPAFSPDGLRIAYAGIGTDGEGDIYVMNANGTNKINLTNHLGADRYPAWSPDGRQIAFASNRNDSFNWEIYVMNNDGTNPRNITNNANANDLNPTWRP